MSVADASRLETARYRRDVARDLLEKAMASQAKLADELHERAALPGGHIAALRAVWGNLSAPHLGHAHGLCLVLRAHGRLQHAHCGHQGTRALLGVASSRISQCAGEAGALLAPVSDAWQFERSGFKVSRRWLFIGGFLVLVALVVLWRRSSGSNSGESSAPGEVAAQQPGESNSGQPATGSAMPPTRLRATGGKGAEQAAGHVLGPGHRCRERRPGALGGCDFQVAGRGVGGDQ